MTERERSPEIEAPEPTSNEVAKFRQAALRDALAEAATTDLCQCPRCGRAHRHLGEPPGLKPRGISRMADNDRAVLLTFDRPLTDDELRQLHENRLLSDGGFRDPAGAP